MMIIGIDPGFEKTGYAVFEYAREFENKCRYVTSGLIKTSKTTPHIKRLAHIADELELVIHEHSVEEMAMEQLFFFKNAKTVIGVAQAQGAIMYLASRSNIPMTFLTPLQIKLAITGYGTADKQAVYKMLTLTLGEKIAIADDDQSDAIACGLAYCLSKQ